MSRVHSFDTHARAYTFPEGHVRGFRDAFFHHESDRAPVATGVADGVPYTVAPSRCAQHWRVGAPMSAAAARRAVPTPAPAQRPPLTIDFVAQRKGGKPINITFEVAEPVRTAEDPRTAICPLPAAQLQPLSALNVHQTPQMLRIQSPAGQADALLDATQYGAGTYLLYVGSNGILTLDVDTDGQVAQGQFQLASHPHNIAYEQEEVGTPLVGLKLKLKRPGILGGKSAATPEQLTTSQTQLEADRQRVERQLDVLVSNYRGFTAKHDYDAKLNRFLRYRGAAATEAIEAELKREVDLLERDAADYERQLKLFKVVEKQVTREIKQNFKKAVKFRKVDPKGEFKAIERELRDIRKKAIPQVAKNRAYYQAEQEARADLQREQARMTEAQRERTRQLQQAREALAREPSAEAQAATEARAIAEAEAEMQIQAEEAAEAAEAAGAAGAGAEAGTANEAIGHMVTQLDHGVHVKVGAQFVKVRSLESHAPIFFQHQEDPAQLTVAVVL